MSLLSEAGSPSSHPSVRVPRSVATGPLAWGMTPAPHLYWAGQYAAPPTWEGTGASGVGAGVEPLTCDLAPLRGKLRDAAFAAAVQAELDVN